MAATLSPVVQNLNPLCLMRYKMFGDVAFKFQCLVCFFPVSSMLSVTGYHEMYSKNCEKRAKSSFIRGRYGNFPIVPIVIRVLDIGRVIEMNMNQFIHINSVAQFHSRFAFIT